MKMNESICYKGVYITRLFPSGYYEARLNGTFITFDNLTKLKLHISTLIKTKVL